MPDPLATLTARICAAFPDLAFAEAALIDEGADHQVVVLDGAWVFRFPRTAEQAASFPAEVRLLEALGPKLRIAAPRYVFLAPDLSFGGYRFIPGRPFTPLLFRAMPGPTQERFLVAMAEFLTTLHAMPAEAIATPAGLRSDEGWAAGDVRRYFERRRPRLAAHLAPELIARLDRAHEGYAEVRWERGAVIHADVREGHILLDRDDRLSGIIDFGDAVLGDPAYDLTFFWALGERAARLVCDRYGGTAEKSGLLERSRWSFVRFSVSRLALTLERPGRYDIEELEGQLVGALDALGV